MYNPVPLDLNIDEDCMSRLQNTPNKTSGTSFQWGTRGGYTQRPSTLIHRAICCWVEATRPNLTLFLLLTELTSSYPRAL